jgi:hypothetical protein
VKVTVDLPEMMLRALSALARAEDVAVGQLARDAITLDLRLRAKPKRDDRTDAALAALLCALLAKDLAGSTSWRDLHYGLTQHGFAMRPASEGLVLCAWDSGQKAVQGIRFGPFTQPHCPPFWPGFSGAPSCASIHDGCTRERSHIHMIAHAKLGRAIVK